MLNDPERKLLRILNNYLISKKHTPSIDELRTKTGRHEYKIRQSLNTLNENGFITWEGEHVQSIRILQAWEEEMPVHRSSTIPYGKL